MIHEIGVELGAYLATQGVPFTVVDGPEPTTTTTWGRERIVIEHDDGNDAFGPQRSQPRNSRHRGTRTANYKLTIYAQSKVAGPQVFEHKRRAEQVLDQIYVAMDNVAANRRNRWQAKSGQFITPPDLKASERQGGAAYELKFTFDRAIITTTFAGEARPEFAITAGGISSTTQVSRAGDQSDRDGNDVPVDAEVACGG